MIDGLIYENFATSSSVVTNYVSGALIKLTLLKIKVLGTVSNSSVFLNARGCSSSGRALA